MIVIAMNDNNRLPLWTLLEDFGGTALLNAAYHITTKILCLSIPHALNILYMIKRKEKNIIYLW